MDLFFSRGYNLHVDASSFGQHGLVAVSHVLCVPCYKHRVQLGADFRKSGISAGIFLLSDSSALRSCQYSGNLGGVLIAVDAKAAKESLVTVCSTLGMRLDTRIVKEKMTARNGCMALCGTPWTQSFFETVRYLSEQEQERYCVFKSVELLYLLCTEVSESNGSLSGAGGPAR